MKQVPDAVPGVSVLEDLVITMFFVFQRSVVSQAPGQVRSVLLLVL